ncbi:MAG: P-loop NTPase [Spirochaetes bacterium]|nr:P-loop NTPase [Spirochaetota bacterium]
MSAKHVLTVFSGKGGTGKTVVSSSLALYCAREWSKRTLIVDADFNLPNVHLLFKVFPDATLGDVWSGRPGPAKLKSIIQTSELGVDVLSLFANTAKEMSRPALSRLAADILKLPYDVVIFDIGAGINNALLSFMPIADTALLVSLNDPFSFLDAFKTIQQLGRHTDHEARLCFLLNQSYREKDALRASVDLIRLVDEQLSVNLAYLGAIPYDPSIRESVSRQEPFLLSRRSPGAKALRAVAATLFGIPRA